MDVPKVWYMETDIHNLMKTGYTVLAKFLKLTMSKRYCMFLTRTPARVEIWHIINILIY